MALVRFHFQEGLTAPRAAIKGTVMRHIVKLVIGAVLALSAATGGVAHATAKSDSSCNDRYGYYGYSSAYCEHSVYGRSSPADRYYGQDRDLAWRSHQEFGPMAEREQDSYRDPEAAVRDRDDQRHSGDGERGQLSGASAAPGARE